MGKCGVRSCGEQRRCSSAVPEAAGYLTLRSGRRVPAMSVAGAACSPRRNRRQHCRGGSGRWCGGAQSSRGSPRRKSAAAAAGVLQCCRVVTSQLGVGGGRRSEQESPAHASDPVARDDGCGDSSRQEKTLHSGEALKKRHQYEADGGVIAADRPPARSPPSEAEMEAFFAAAELAERRRFAETYNYDVALDRPLEGRFEWAPVST